MDYWLITCRALVMVRYHSCFAAGLWVLYLITVVVFSAVNTLILCCPFYLQYFKEIYQCAVQLPVISSMKLREHIILFQQETQLFFRDSIGCDSDGILNRMRARKGQKTVPVLPCCLYNDGSSVWMAFRPRVIPLHQALESLGSSK